MLEKKTAFCSQGSNWLGGPPGLSRAPSSKLFACVIAEHDLDGCTGMRRERRDVGKAILPHEEPGLRASCQIHRCLWTASKTTPAAGLPPRLTAPAPARVHCRHLTSWNARHTFLGREKSAYFSLTSPASLLCVKGCCDSLHSGLARYACRNFNLCRVGGGPAPHIFRPLGP